MNKLKRIIFTTMAALGLVLPAAVPVAAQNINENLNCGANLSFNGQNCDTDPDAAGDAVDNIVENVINVISLAVGVIAVVMIIIGGMRYITSSGESGNVTGAKNTIMYAVVGLVVVALAQIIVRFVVQKSTEPAGN